MAGGQTTFTYSFKDVQATLSGPGGIISLGNGAGVAEEGISCEQIEDKTSWQIGADGSVAFSLHAAEVFRITVRLLKTSPTNQQLSQMYTVQKTSSLFWGQNTLVVTENITGDQYNGSQVAIVKFPANTYAKEARTVEWEFICGFMTQILGGAGLLIS
jgi:hypothetical protein